MARVECSEFLSRFSDFYDGSPDPRFRQLFEAHLEHCEKCARYERAVASGAALLRTLPRIEPSESFRPTLEHRLFHLEDENTLVRAAGSSAVPVLTAVGIAIVLAIIAWPPTLGRSTPQVALAPIVVTGPPNPEPRTRLPRRHRGVCTTTAGSGSGEGTVVGPQRAALRVFPDA